MKIFAILLVGIYAAFDKEAMGKQFQAGFKQHFKNEIAMYTLRKKVNGVKTFVNKEKALALATSLSLKEADFAVSFNFCDINKNEFVSRGELKKCEKRAVKVMHKALPDEDIQEVPDEQVRSRLRFDFDRDHKLNRQEFMASNAVLNLALAKTMIDMFDGFNGGNKDQALNGITEIAGMGAMLSSFYSGVNQKEARAMLSTSNVEIGGDTRRPTRDDRAKITENELRDFLQKIMTVVLQKCLDNPECI